jgi:predicted ester cyclase
MDVNQSAQDNKDIVSRFVKSSNKANHAIVDELFAANFVHHFKDPRLPAGREAMKLLGGMVVTGFPDVHATVEDLLADGDKVIERTTATGTHKGEFNGVPAHRQAGRLTEIHIYRLADRKIAEPGRRSTFAIMMQVGCIRRIAGRSGGAAGRNSAALFHLSVGQAEHPAIRKRAKYWGRVKWSDLAYFLMFNGQHLNGMRL